MPFNFLLLFSQSCTFVLCLEPAIIDFAPTITTRQKIDILIFTLWSYVQYLVFKCLVRYNGSTPQ